MSIRKNNMAGCIGGHIIFMGNQNDSLPHGIEMRKYFHNFPRGFTVQIPCRFICHDNGGIIYQRSGYGHTLPLAA